MSKQSMSSRAQRGTSQATSGVFRELLRCAQNDGSIYEMAQHCEKVRSVMSSEVETSLTVYSRLETTMRDSSQRNE